MQNSVYRVFFSSEYEFFSFSVDLQKEFFSDIHLLKSSMTEKSTKPTLEQITDKLEELEVDKQQGK